MFDGRDYQREFENTCEELTTATGSIQARRQLVSLEWVLCEAISKSFLTFSMILAAIITALLFWRWDTSNLTDWGIAFYAIGAVLTYLAASIVSYWIQKLVFWYEVSRHVSGRKFGSFKWQEEHHWKNKHQ